MNNIVITGFEHGVLEKILANAEESTNQPKKMHEEAMARQDKLLDILEKFVKKQ